MKEENTVKHTNEFYDEIDFRELFNVLFQGKWIIVSFTTFMSTIAVIYSLLLPNIYESRALLVPANSSSSISGALQNYSSLAGLAGINLPSSDVDNSIKALKKIGSLSFFEDNIMPNIYLPDLMAVKTWDYKTNTLVFNESIFKVNSNKWVRAYSYPQKQIPSAQESFDIFKSEHLILNEDKKSGFITLLIKHQSPYVAKQWVELIVNEVNNYFRQKDKSESEKAVIYLNQQISMTGLSEIKEVLAQLLQEETKKLMLIEANQFYVFDYIDPPATMEKKSGPQRALICILGALLGVMLSVLLVLVRHYAFNEKNS
tara:strand:+ start:271 stop:1215 length:945 start_codon:yes stop_codon:yes gene_type:complete